MSDHQDILVEMLGGKLIKARVQERSTGNTKVVACNVKTKRFLIGLDALTLGEFNANYRIINRLSKNAVFGV